MGGRTALLNGPDGGHTVGQTMDGGEQGAQHDQISPRHLLLHEDLLCTLAEAEDQNVPGGSHRGMQNPFEGLSTEHRIRPVVGQSLLRCRQQLAGPGGTERNVCVYVCMCTLTLLPSAVPFPQGLQYYRVSVTRDGQTVRCTVGERRRWSTPDTRGTHTPIGSRTGLPRRRRSSGRSWSPGANSEPGSRG